MTDKCQGEVDLGKTIKKVFVNINKKRTKKEGRLLCSM